MLRVGSAVFCLLVSAVLLCLGMISGSNASVFLGLSILWLVGAVASIVVVHWLVRLVVWIVEGFKSGGKAAE